MMLGAERDSEGASTQPLSNRAQQTDDVRLKWEFGDYKVVNLNEYTFEVVSETLAETYDSDAPAEVLSGVLAAGQREIEVQFRIRSVQGEQVRCGFFDLPISKREAVLELRRSARDQTPNQLHGLSYDQLAQGPSGGSPKADDAEQAPPGAAATFKKAMAVLVLGGSMLGILVWISFVIRSRSTVEVANSVMVGNYYPINTPLEGLLVEVRAQVGDHVSQGEVLATISNPQVVEELALLDAKLLRARREREAYQRQADKARATMKFARRKIQEDQNIAQADAQRVKAQLQSAQSQLQRLEPLEANNNIGLFEIEEARVLVATVQAEQLRQEALLRTTRLAAEAIEHDVLISDTSVSNPLTEFQTQIALAEAAIDELTEKRKAVAATAGDAELVAPRAGTIYAIYRHPGEFLKAADEAIALSIDDGGWASGHIAPHLAPSVKPGQPVEVNVPSLGVVAAGKIAGIGHRAVYGRGRYNADFRGGSLTVPIRVDLEPLDQPIPSGLRLNMTVRIRDHLADFHSWVDGWLGRESEAVTAVNEENKVIAGLGERR